MLRRQPFGGDMTMIKSDLCYVTETILVMRDLRQLVTSWVKNRHLICEDVIAYKLCHHGAI